MLLPACACSRCSLEGCVCALTTNERTRLRRSALLLITQCNIWSMNCACLQEIAALQAATLKHVEPELTEPQFPPACAQSETAVKQVESVSSTSKQQVSKPLCHVSISAHDASWPLCMATIITGCHMKPSRFNKLYWWTPDSP